MNVRQPHNVFVSYFMCRIQFPKQAGHKLHLVTLTRSGIGRSYWEKICVKKPRLTRRLKSVVRKNTPEINKDLNILKQ